MSSEPHWVRRTYDAPGLTQHPVGPHLEALQAHFAGSVVLCLDVSWSMSGASLPQAVRGCARFIDEALAAGYAVSLLLWNTDVVASTGLSREKHRLEDALGSAVASGGTNIVPALLRAEALLGARTGDRVIAVFGDGDLGDPSGARQASDAICAQGIRIITCGLGFQSAESLDVISTESDGGGLRVAEADGIAEAIAGMASGLRRGSRKGG